MARGSLAAGHEGRLAQMWNRAHHDAKTPWSLPGEIVGFYPKSRHLTSTLGEFTSFQLEKEEPGSTGPQLSTSKR